MKNISQVYSKSIILAFESFEFTQNYLHSPKRDYKNGIISGDEMINIIREGYI